MKAAIDSTCSKEGPKSKITAWPSTSYRSTQAVRNGRTPWLQNPCMDAILMHIFIHSSQPLQPNRSFAAASTPISANRHHHPSRYTTHGHLHGCRRPYYSVIQHILMYMIIPKKDQQLAVTAGHPVAHCQR
ncbi:hypothetical protein BDA96_09G101900 [Sorghum bicolor]|uniref:Uncharacterized protein n=2 Tax=Sorghum bicolor TaxID=4558 RepID=A0A921Q9E0_SORBI|nr:hypothetical protein BDA96_09G101900 [Sorghum bicolor]OQU77757.1 hypothetical protein SORBI_3009G098150 [Sorghum bicolor]